MGADAAATSPVLEVQVLTEEMGKKEIEAHIDRFHVRPHYVNSKTAKAEIVKWHTRLHDLAETNHPDHQHEIKRGFKTGSQHIHREISASDFRAEGGLVLDLIKPLTTSEANALTQVINNDFAALASDMKAMAADTKRDRVAEVTREWDRKKDQSGDYAVKARALVEKWQQDRARLIDKALADGVELKMPDLRYAGDVQTTLVGRAQAIQDVQTEVTNDLNRALLALERQKLAAQRTVVLARVTPEAQRVLDQVPDAKTLMVQAAQERTQREISND